MYTKLSLNQEFLETLESVENMPNDWDVVFPDCPIKADKDIKGVYSVSG